MNAYFCFIRWSGGCLKRHNFDLHNYWTAPLEMPHLNISENLIQSSDRVALFLTIISIIIGLKRTHYIQNMFFEWCRSILLHVRFGVCIKLWSWHWIPEILNLDLSLEIETERLQSWSTFWHWDSEISFSVLTLRLRDSRHSFGLENPNLVLLIPGPTGEF